MTFKEVAYRNFKCNIKKYMAYFLCSSFSIMIFFIFSNLIFNASFSKAIEANQNIKDFLGIALIAVVIYSIFFISYAHTSFIRSRKKEFGLFLALGMTQKDIRKVIWMENGLVGLLSLILGLLSGTVFARLAFMAIIRMLGLHGIYFALSPQSYILSMLLLFFIFIVILFFSGRATKRLQISELMKEGRKAQRIGKTHPLLGLAGVFVMALSLWLIHLHLTDRLMEDQNYIILVCIAVCLAGLYVVISQFGGTILQLIKKERSIYYRNLLVTTEIHKKFRQNKNVIFTVSMLSAMMLFFIGSAYSLYAETLNTATREQPFHLAYMEVYDVNRLQQDQLDKIIHGGETTVAEQKSIKFMQVGRDIGQPYMGRTAVISVNEFNAAFGSHLSLDSGEVSILNLVENKSSDRRDIPQTICLIGKEKKCVFRIKASTYKILINIMDYLPREIAILNQKDYQMLYEEAAKDSIGTIHLINFDDWHKTKEISKRLNEALKEHNEKFSEYYKSTNPQTAEYWFKAKSRIDVYHTLRQEGAMLLFITSFIGLLFFISSGSVLYFKLFTEIGETREKYTKLFKLGITDREMRTMISKELLLIFSIPFVLGCMLGYAYLGVLTINSGITKEILGHSIVIIGVYFVFQMIFYVITRNRHLQEILG